MILWTNGGTVDRDPDMTINNSYERLEAGTVYIYSGRYYVTADDDGINAAGGSSDGTDPGTGGGNNFNPGGGGLGGRAMTFGGFDGARLLATSDYSLNIMGGNVYVNADGDGLDSNGALTLTGGNIEVWGPSSGDNEPLDYDGTLTVNGATIFAAGCAGMGMASPLNSQSYKNFSNSYSSNTVIVVSNGGSTVYNAKAPKSASYAFFSAPNVSSPTLSTGSSVDCQYGNDWTHAWNDGVVTTAATTSAAGVRTYTCSACGETETIPQLVSIPEDEDSSGSTDTDTEEDTGYAVTFVTDGNCSINVYYKQSYTTPDDTGVTSAVSRDGDSGSPDSTGDGQVNFTVIPADGYEVSSVTATEGAYKNIKDISSDAGIANTYRITKITAALTVTVTTTASESQSATVTGITVKTSPTKTAYTVGDSFDPSGLVLTVTFDESKSDWAPLRQRLKETLSDEEYAAAAKSTLNAHYTSQDVIQGVYGALEHLGFKGGRLLEPSAGIGHFNGAMPAGLRGKSHWTMVELDPVTGGIAKALYPNADVRIQGFESALLPDNYFDAAISNVPFGNIRVFDNAYKPFLTRSIHNYFFAKSLDKVRPGGVVAFITSRYTLDSVQASDVRRYLSSKADLLGAVRLPNTAFKSNAGTDVVADILILKKRPPNTPYAGAPFVNAEYKRFLSDDGTALFGDVNEYFQRRPEMVLGTPAQGKLYGHDSLTWKPKDSGKSLREQITEAFATVTGHMEYPVSRTREELRAEIRKDAAKGKVGGLVKRDGKIYRNVNGSLEEASDVPKRAEEEVSAIVSLRDAARALLNFQLDGAPEQQIQNSRKGLNALYDSFVKKYGPLHLPKNQRLVKLDVEAPFILSLETYDKDTKTAAKAAIFTKNTVSRKEVVAHADTVEDALTVSINETGGIDAARMAELTGQTPEAVTQSLLKRGLAFLNRDGSLETAEQYLSGNVRAKLKDAEALAAGNPAYRRNVDA